MTAKITRHGEHRVREKLGIPKGAVARMAEKALTEGAAHADFSGNMKRYLDGVFLRHRNATNMRVYNQHLFLFNGETLITAWPLQGKFRKAATKAQTDHDDRAKGRAAA